MDEIANAILAWYKENRQNYFFRKKRTTYKVWICEVILQQTRIQAALIPLQKFLISYPDIKSLANSSEEKVLQVFKGLGYYNRARNLYKGARFIMNHYQGKFPRTVEELLKIPSIGPYTAGIISSVCFGNYTPAIDGNVLRLFSRFLMINIPLDKIDLKKSVEKYLLKFFSQGKFNPGDLNEALMELGQRLCKKVNPLCLKPEYSKAGTSIADKNDCPIYIRCRAYKEGKISDFPISVKKIKKMKVTWNLFILYDDKNSNNRKILTQKWNEFYFLKGLRGFPSILEFSLPKKQIISWSQNGKEKISKMKESLLGFQKYRLNSFSHTITHHAILVRPYLLSWKIFAGVFPKDMKFIQKSYQEFNWIPQKKIYKLLVSSMLTKAWEKAENVMLKNELRLGI